MPYPSPPEISTSYTAQEQALGDGTLPGQELDVDLASIRASVTAVIEFVKGITRSDGKLANGVVTQEALGAALILGFDPPSVWATGVAYTTRSIVFEGTRIYLCLAPHTSSVFATDLASGRWSLLADLTPVGGALVASNNLSDLPDVPNARANLGLGSMATASSGTGASQHRTNLQNEAVFQPLAANLTAWAALVGAADKLGYFTGSGAAALTDLSPFARTILDDANGAAVLTTISGQPLSPNLTQLAAPTFARGDLVRRGASALERLTPAAVGQTPFFDGTDTVFGRDEYFFRLDAARAGANDTSNQSILGVGVTVEAGFVYEYELITFAVKSAGTTSHNFLMGYGGTAVIGVTLRHVLTRLIHSVGPTDLTYVTSLVNMNMATFMTGVGSASINHTFTERGTFSVTTGGTLIPQYQLSAAPGGAYTTGGAYTIRAGSFMRLRKIGASGANVSFGPWA